MKISSLLTGSLSVLDLNESLLSLLLIPTGNWLHFLWVVQSKTVLYLIAVSEVLFKDLLKFYVHFSLLHDSNIWLYEYELIN